MPTNQEAFDTAFAGILKQGGPSRNERGVCFYRGENGRKCGIGWLIPDEMYDKNLEYHTVRIDHISTLMKKIGYEDSTFLEKLQKCHDYSKDLDFINEFKANMEKLAESYGLKYREPNLVESV